MMQQVLVTRWGRGTTREVDWQDFTGNERRIGRGQGRGGRREAEEARRAEEAYLSASFPL